MTQTPPEQLLSGLLTNTVSLIDEVSATITEAHFTDPTLRNLYRMILTFRSIGEGVLPATAVSDSTKGLDAGAAAHVTETYFALMGCPVDAPSTRWAAHQLRTEREHSLTASALRDATEIVSSTVTEEPGPTGQPGRTWSGAADAREWMRDRMMEIDSEVTVADTPAADVLTEAESVLRDYAAAASEDRAKRPRFGIPALDDLIGGLGKGEMGMLAAPSGLGKTQACVSLAYNASYLQGLNVYFATSETVRETVRARIIARHSRHPKFEAARDALDLPFGLDSQLISRGALQPSHIPFMVAVLKDFQGTSTGACWVAQMPHGQNMPTLGSLLTARDRARETDLVIVDYLALMSGTRRYASRREELVSIITDAKHLAVDHARGRGVPLVSPWQFNRESQKELTRTGILDLSGLAETSEAVNSADLVLSLSPDGERTERHASLKLHLLKNRDGRVLLGDNAIPLYVDYGSSYFEPRVSATDTYTTGTMDLDSGFTASLLND